MTLDLVCFQQSTFQEHVLFKRVCIISGLQFYVKRLSARYWNIKCVYGQIPFVITNTYMQVSTYHSMTRVNLGGQWGQHSHCDARTSEVMCSLRWFFILIQAEHIDFYLICVVMRIFVYVLFSLCILVSLFLFLELYM